MAVCRRDLNRLNIDHPVYNMVAVADKDFLILKRELFFCPGAEHTLRFFQGATIFPNNIPKQHTPSLLHKPLAGGFGPS